jgi:HAD superfamily hydrolase (TIGR01509 family)
MPKAVLFDIDGTLIDTVDLHAASWREVFHRYGRELSHEEVRRQIGRGGDQLMPLFLPEALVARKGEEIEAERTELFFRDYFPRARAFPGVRDIMERVRAAGQKVVLASSGKAEEVARYVDLAGIADLIDEATSSDDAERSKPHPDIFAAAMARLAPLRPEEAVVIGDSPFDAVAAGRLGIKTIGVLCGGFPRAVLNEAGCAAVCWDLHELSRRHQAGAFADL